ncbi:MAG: phosphonopyruvate decarboxylase, partial [Spirochaetaceae bacterium]|nr:phosphonopyruvate decarboxylase [Spirochaetaceae bacterium]
MISVQFFCEELRRRGVEFFCGVPDSLLKDFCAYIDSSLQKSSGIAAITAVNEGAALALAAGHYLASNRIPLVFMQNSGLGNALNPLLSLCDRDVYGIPALLLIGWRGEPGDHDEPQHITQGRLTCPLLETSGIPYLVMADTENALCGQLDEVFRTLRLTGAPVALVVRKAAFAPWKPPPAENTLPASREEAIEQIMLSSPLDFFFSTTGMASRELYELREKHGMGHGRDFLTVGSMGHASSIALGAALARPDAAITCLDGDGAALMHLGAFASIGVLSPPNLRHIVLNNGSHDSVGGQPTVAFSIDLGAIARASGYKHIHRA